MKTIERPRVLAHPRAGFAARLAGLAAALLPVVPLEAPPALRAEAEPLRLSELTVAVVVTDSPATDAVPTTAMVTPLVAESGAAESPASTVAQARPTSGGLRVTVQAGAVRFGDE